MLTCAWTPAGRSSTGEVLGTWVGGQVEGGKYWEAAQGGVHGVVVFAVWGAWGCYALLLDARRDKVDRCAVGLGRLYLLQLSLCSCGCQLWSKSGTVSPLLLLWSLFLLLL